jgi:hypothetical protein
MIVNATYTYGGDRSLGAWGWRALAILKDALDFRIPVVAFISVTAMFAALGWNLHAAIDASQHANQTAIDSAQHANQAAIALVLDRLSSDEAKLATDEERLTYVEKDEAEHYAASLAWQNKVGGQTDTILQALADLKVQLALKANIRER